MLLLIVLSVLAGQNPMDMLIAFVGKIMVFIFMLMVVGAPIALIAYIFILLFSNATDNMSTPFTEQTKHRIGRFTQSFTGSPQAKKKPPPKGKKKARKKPPKPSE